MFTPLRSSLTSESSNIDNPEGVLLALQSELQSVAVTHDGFSIGSSRHCDLRLMEDAIQPLHSLIRMQCGAIWIEAADDETVLTVNDRPCRRMALRHGDRLKIGATEFTTILDTENVALFDQSVIDDDLALLTAEELCDRIVSEQSIVNELSDEHHSGWEALLHAIEAVGEEPQASELADENLLSNSQELVDYDALLGQIQELNETIADRTRELNAHEAEVLASTSILEESQQRVSQRLDEILDQLAKTEPPTEFRASA